MATAGGSGTRDARRRRIVDRGSDRLALITGKIQTLPTPPTSSPPDGSYSPPPFAALDQPRLPTEDKLAETLLRKLESSFDAPEPSSTKPDSGTRSPPEGTSEILAFKDQPSTESSQLSQQAVGPNETPSVSRAASPRSSGNAQPSSLPANIVKLINPNHISSAIITSTTTRLLCSAIGGLLVVLSSIGFPLLGSWLIRGILTFRPLYLLLLTNVTIVAARVMSYKQWGNEKAAAEENKALSNDESGWADQVGTSLELGFLLMKVLDAVLMDCSLYALVVVCGLSFFQMILSIAF